MEFLNLVFTSIICFHNLAFVLTYLLVWSKPIVTKSVNSEQILIKLFELLFDIYDHKDNISNLFNISPVIFLGDVHKEEVWSDEEGL